MCAAFRNRRERSTGGSSDDLSDTIEEVDIDDVDAPTDDPEGEWLAYELHEWALESRVMLQQLLAADQVVHSWQGTTLMVHETLEEKIDALIDEVDDATNRRIEPGDEVVAFEMEGWSAELQGELIERLGATALPHEFDEDGDLVVREDDEEQVELVIDDLLARADELDLDELDGLEANELLSDLYLACDRLRRDPHDADGVLGAVDAGRRLTEVRSPFGFSATSWKGFRSAAAALVELLEGDDGDDDDLRELAQQLRDALQRVI